MNRASMAIAVVLLALAGWGCADRPHEYGEERPDVNQLTPGDTGLQSKDVTACTSQLVSDLLSSPQLNTSATQWTLAVDHVQDMTTDRSFAQNYDIFIQSLHAAISQKAQGRIQLIADLGDFQSIRDRQMTGGNADQYQQGGGPTGPPAPGAINPDYILYGKAMDMPNRNTNFYILQFTIFNTHTRAEVWTRDYQVKTAR